MSNLLQLEDESKPTLNNEPSPAEIDQQTFAERVKRGANWFYWIAGLSAVNSLAFMFGANFAFIAGLGFTLIADAVVDASIQQGAPAVLRAVAIIFDLILVIGLALLGYYGNKRYSWAFMLGLTIYALDTLVVLALGDYLMALFHGWAFYNLVRGFLACRQLRALDLVAPAESVLVPPPPSF